MNLYISSIQIIVPMTCEWIKVKFHHTRPCIVYGRHEDHKIEVHVHG